MTALLIETSSLQAWIALANKENLKRPTPLPGNNQLSKFLLPSLEDLLSEEGLTLDYMAVGTGPGSFTGTRVGVTVAQTLSFALKIPLIGFPSQLAAELAAEYVYGKWVKGEFEPIELSYEGSLKK